MKKKEPSLDTILLSQSSGIAVYRLDAWMRVKMAFSTAEMRKTSGSFGVAARKSITFGAILEKNYSSIYLIPFTGSFSHNLRLP